MRANPSTADLRVALASAWLLTKYWWAARRGASPAELSARIHARSWRAVGASLPSARVVAIVSRVAGVHPLHPACLPQALTACHLLLSAGRTATVRLGVVRHGDNLNAHAWVHASDLPADREPSGFVRLGDIDRAPNPE